MEAGGERKGSADPADTGGDESADHKRQQDTGEGTKTSDTEPRLQEPSGAPPAAAYTFHPYLHAGLSKEHRPWPPSPSLHDQQTPPYTTFAHHPSVVCGGISQLHAAPGSLSPSLHEQTNEVMKLKPAASTCTTFVHHPLVKKFQGEQKVSKKNSPTRYDLGNVYQGNRSNPDPTAPSLLLSPGIIYPQHRDDPSASKPGTNRRKYSFRRSLSSPSSTSHSTVSLLKSRLESWSQLEAATRSSVHSSYKYLYLDLHGKKTEPAVETAENEGSRPVQISQVTQDLQHEPKSLKIYPDGDDTDIFSFPEHPTIPVPASLMTDSHSRASVLPSCSQSSIPDVNDPECSHEEHSRVFLLPAESSPDQNVSAAAPSAIITEQVPAPSSLPPSPPLQAPSCLARSHSAPSLSRTPQSSFRRAASLPDMRVQEFTPAVGADGDDETYRFRCSRPGLYRCSVSGLLFGMTGGGAVLYRTVPWSRRLLGQHRKKPAGPLFDIKCPQQSVRQLHLPHCDIISTGGARSLQVAHVTDESVEFIDPDQVTQTHVVLNISGFSAYGNVKDEDSPPEPVRALVLLFYKPPQDPDLRSVLSVLLLPRNVVIRDVLRTRKKVVGDERYIETSPHCKLQPKQSYSLSTSPEDDSVLVQPTEADFDEDSYDNYFPSFQVMLEILLNSIHLCLRGSSSSDSVWQRKVYLSPCGPAALNRPPNQRLPVQSCFIDGISGPVLSSLLDKLQEEEVITDGEREAADGQQSRAERARLLFHTVRRKGATSKMMEFLREIDPYFCNNLGLI